MLAELINSLIYPCLFAVWLAAVIGVIVFGCKRFRRVHKTTWYDLSSTGPSEEMEWCQIRMLMKYDPMDKHEIYGKFRKCSSEYWLIDTALVLLAIAFLGIFLATIYQVFYSPEEGVREVSNSSNVLTDLAVFAGAPIVVVGIVSLLYQIRLRARSANRQDWINSIRTEIGKLIDSLPEPAASVHSVEQAILEAQPHINRLELYLNPRERVHRGFLAIIRFLYGFPESPTDGEARCRLCIPAGWVGQNVDGVNATREDWEKWRMRAVRLANVLLKREWEQVKHAK